LHQYLSSALVPPTPTASSVNFTNLAYLKLLECKTNVDANPPAVIKLPNDSFPVLLPADWMKSASLSPTTRLQMIAGSPISPHDARRTIFQSLEAHVETKLDLLEAVVAPMYTEGKISNYDIDDEYLHAEMTCEVRLNLQAFYLRCAHFPFLASSLQIWSNFAVSEYGDLAQSGLLQAMGLSEFVADAPMAATNRTSWSRNFSILAERMGGGTPALWMDLYALQLLFSGGGIPVFFAPIYGKTAPTMGHQLLWLIPSVPEVSILNDIRGLEDVMKDVLATEFMVVPFLAIEKYNAGFLSTSEAMVPLDVDLCTTIVHLGDMCDP